MLRLLSILIFAVILGPTARAEDWPMLGRDHTHNAVSPEKGAPIDWEIGTKDAKGAIRKIRNIKWSSEVGSTSLGGPVIANGLVWVGTNNGRPRDPKFTNPMKLSPVTKKPVPIDMSVLMCFRESDGEFLWQYTSGRLKEMIHDMPTSSMGSTPLIEGDRLWLITNRCETVCFDIGPLQRGEGKPKELWKVNMIKTFDVFPHGASMSMGMTASPASDAERVFAVTNNGVDEEHIRVASPNAPSLIAFDKKTGDVRWKDNSPGKDIIHDQTSSPLVIDVKGKTQVIVGQGDGWLRSFDAKTGQVNWKCDLNPKGAKNNSFGHGRKNNDMAAPVFHDGRIYVAPGQEVEHYVGESDLFCIDPTGAGDVSAELDDGKGKEKANPNSRVVWQFGGPDNDPNARRDYRFGRTVCRCTVHDGLVYAVDLEGCAYCLDAKTGRLLWTDDLRSGCRATPLWVDGKVYFATDDGDVTVFAHGRQKKILAKIEMNLTIYASPAFANGVLYILTDRMLYAITARK